MNTQIVRNTYEQNKPGQSILQENKKEAGGKLPQISNNSGLNKGIETGKNQSAENTSSSKGVIPSTQTLARSLLKN